MTEEYQDKELLEELYWGQELSTGDIGDRLGCTGETVRYYLEKYDIPRRNSELTSKETPEPWNDIERLNELYWGEGLSTREIAERLGASRETIRQRLNEDGDGTDQFRHLRAKPPYFGTTASGHERFEVGEYGDRHHIPVHQLGALAAGILTIEEFYDPGVVIHHKNTIPWDNRPENWEKMTASQHAAHHNQTDKATE